MVTALKAMIALLLLMSTAGVPSVEETDDGMSTRAARLSAWRRSNSHRSGRAGCDAESGACRPPQAGDAPQAGRPHDDPSRSSSWREQLVAPVVHAHAHSSVEVTLPPGEVGTDDPFKADGLSMQREWPAHSALKLSMAVPHPADALVGLRLKADPGQTQAVGVTAARPSIHVVCSGLVAGSLYWLDASFYKHGEQVFQESQPLEAPVERAHSSVEVTLPPDTAGMHHVDLTLFDAVDATMLAKRTNVKHAFPERLLVCANPRWLWPDCKACVPGLQGPSCDESEFPEITKLQQHINQLAVERYGARGQGGHLYPYLETSAFQQRQIVAVNHLKKVRAQRILDFGAYFNPLERFADFDQDWCPDLILSIDPIYRGNSQGIRCRNSSGWVTVVHAPLSAQLALENLYIASKHFDSVVCMGCDPNYGPTLQQLEGFRRPYQLVLESPFDSFLQSPTLADGKLLFTQVLHLPDPPREIYHGPSPYTKRTIKIIEYGEADSSIWKVDAREDTRKTAKAVTFDQESSAYVNLLPSQFKGACQGAIMPKAASECPFPFSIQNLTTESEQYLHLAEISEKIWSCRGLRSQSDGRSPTFSVGNGRNKRCQMHSNMPERFHFDQAWNASGEAFDIMSQHAVSCLNFQNGVPRGSDPCVCVEKCSLAWLLLNAFDNSEGSTTTSILSVVRTQHRCMKTLFVPKTWRQDPTCIQFPKRRSQLCGGLQSYGNIVDRLEPLYPGGRNLMYHERGTLIDFTSYLPLPSVPGFNTTVQGRKVLLVVGANGFFRAPKMLIDMYSPYWDFDEVYLFEPDAEHMEVPSDYRKKMKITFVQTYVNVGGRNKNDMITFMHSNLNESDYVVLMFDVDDTSTNRGPTMEWGFLADLVSQKRALVDELFIELHMYKPEIGWSFERHSSQEQFDVLFQLRNNCGFAVHAWP